LRRAGSINANRRSLPDRQKPINPILSGCTSQKAEFYKNQNKNRSMLITKKRPDQGKSDSNSLKKQMISSQLFVEGRVQKDMYICVHQVS